VSGERGKRTREEARGNKRTEEDMAEMKKKEKAKAEVKAKKKARGEVKGKAYGVGVGRRVGAECKKTRLKREMAKERIEEKIEVREENLKCMEGKCWIFNMNNRSTKKNVIGAWCPRAKEGKKCDAMF
jgi:hypothetical protein